MGLYDGADVAVGINQNVGDAVDVEADGATRRYRSDDGIRNSLASNEIEV